MTCTRWYNGRVQGPRTLPSTFKSSMFFKRIIFWQTHTLWGTLNILEFKMIKLIKCRRQTIELWLGCNEQNLQNISAWKLSTPGTLNGFSLMFTTAVCILRPLTRSTINKVHFQHFSFSCALIYHVWGEKTQEGKGKSRSKGPTVLYHSKRTSAECFSFIFFSPAVLQLCLFTSWWSIERNACGGWTLILFDCCSE